MIRTMKMVCTTQVASTKYNNYKLWAANVGKYDHTQQSTQKAQKEKNDARQIINTSVKGNSFPKNYLQKVENELTESSSQTKTKNTANHEIKT